MRQCSSHHLELAREIVIVSAATDMSQRAERPEAGVVCGVISVAVVVNLVIRRAGLCCNLVVCRRFETHIVEF